MEVQSDGVGANREHRDRVKHPGRPRVKTQPEPKARNEMAEGEGFEPPVPLRVRLISSQVPSTTQPPFRDSVLLGFSLSLGNSDLPLACILLYTAQMLSTP